MKILSQPKFVRLYDGIRVLNKLKSEKYYFELSYSKLHILLMELDSRKNIYTEDFIMIEIWHSDIKSMFR